MDGCLCQYDFNYLIKCINGIQLCTTVTRNVPVISTQWTRSPQGMKTLKNNRGDRENREEFVFVVYTAMCTETCTYKFHRWYTSVQDV